VAEGLPQLRHVDLECGRRRLGRRPIPELVDQPISRHDPVRVQEKQSEQGALLGATERDLATALDGLQ
jgi:hypothetical protein